MAWRIITRHSLILLFLLLPGIVFSAPPSRTYTYTSGSAISPTEVTTNEDNLYRYVQQGIDKIAENSVTTDNITNGTIINADLSSSLALPDSKLAQITTASKISGAALTSLASIPSGAGDIPAANLTNSLLASNLDTDATLAGNSDTKISSQKAVKTYADKLTSGIIVTGTRSGGGSSGDVAYTGTGFKPKTLIALSAVDNSTYSSIGFADSILANNCIVYNYSGSNLAVKGNLIWVGTSTAYQQATVKSYDSSGFTLTWTAGGSNPGDATLYFLAFP